MKRLVLIVIILVQSVSSYAQLSKFLKPSDTLHIQRRNGVIISQATLATASLIALDQLWYSNYERGSFRTVNDSGDWYGMDKLGHVFSSYQLGRYGYNLLAWSGVREKDRLLYGATIGFAFLTAVEIMDGYSTQWGFSWGDVAANALGTGLFIGQQLLWEEQRIGLKFSFTQSPYAQLNPDLLGNNLMEQIFKDYNGQTYWLSFNVQSFLDSGLMPSWFNIALGYGANGMLNGDFHDPDLPTQNPYQQFYLSLDIDLTRIKTNSHVLRTIFDIFNFIKIPSPTLELTSTGVFKAHIIYF